MLVRRLMGLEADRKPLRRRWPALDRRAARRWLLVLSVLAGGCKETFDAGYNRPNGLLPVDQRNPVILLNDGAYDNWFGEYGVLLANGGRR